MRALRELKVTLKNENKTENKTDEKINNAVKILLASMLFIAIAIVAILTVRGLNSMSAENDNSTDTEPEALALIETTQSSIATSSTTTTAETTTTTVVTTTTFVPFETQRVGNEKVGFIEVPTSWKKIESDNSDKDNYIEYAAVYNGESDSNSDLAYSSIAMEYGELGEKSEQEFIDDEAKQFSAMSNYFNSSDKENSDINIESKFNASDYFTKCTVSGLDAYKFETKMVDYYKDVGYGDGLFTVYVMFLPDKTYRAITVETNTSDCYLVTKLVSTYTSK